MTVFALCAAALSACSNSGVQADQPASAASSTTPAVTTPAIDPAAQPAVTAWHSFLTALAAAQRNPYGINEKPPPGADLTPYAWDPARIEYRTYIAGLKQNGTAFRGTPEVSHTAVSSVDLGAKPSPTVHLTDCLVNSDWDLYVVKTGEVVPHPSASVPPPHPVTITVIRYQNRWGVKKVAFDYDRTCTP